MPVVTGNNERAIPTLGVNGDITLHEALQIATGDLGYNKIDRGNICAGIIVRNGNENFIGPSNRFDENGGFVDGAVASLAISGGSANKVLGNWFGSPTDFIPSSSQEADHIAIFDSADNQIGGLGQNRNVIIRSRKNGILIDGAGSMGNQVSGNMIGVAPTDGPYSKLNNLSGVLISGGASNNIIGGETTLTIGGAAHPVPTGNIIHGNGRDGVRVDGAETLGNKITNNSISNHSVFSPDPPGIQNINGGNAELPPPVITGFDGITVTGTVDGGFVPDGSLVQIFTDPEDEGYQLMAEATVDESAFSAPAGLWVFPNICATVTDLAAGNTSEFACFVTDPPGNLFGLDVLRVENPPGKVNIQAGRSGAVVAMKLTNSGASQVQVQSMTFVALGSVNESTEVVGLSIHQDKDQDGSLSPGDLLLADGATFDLDNGETTFEGMGAPIAGGTEQHWLLVATLENTAALGETLEFQLLDNTKIESSGMFPATAIIETGGFPLNSDIATVTTQVPSSEEISQTIVSGIGYDPAMDFNNDGVVDVADVVAAEQF